MNYDEFNGSLASSAPPASLSLYLESLWYDGKNNWEKAHEVAQDINDKDGSWLHAYLHRKEGDNGNAAYWYRRAGKPVPAYSLQQEWKEMVQHFLKH